MKQVAVLVAMLLLTTAGVGQSRHSAHAETPMISSWMRHAGVHYLDLIDEMVHTRAIKDSSERDRAQAMYGKFLDDEEVSLTIDAKGFDRIFLDGMLKQLRAHLDNLILTPPSIYRVYEARVARFVDCESDTKEAITSGQLTKSALEGCAAPFILPSAAPVD
jgi:hypothetical protein